jgi:hypothetical protein
VHKAVSCGGERFPDYLLAYCAWLLSDPKDPAAWFDSASGDRTLTIQAVEAVSPFVCRRARHSRHRVDGPNVGSAGGNPGCAEQTILIVECAEWLASS